MPHRELTFFLDRSLGRIHFPSALRAAGIPIVVHDDEFGPDATDVEWIGSVAARGYVAVTKDVRIRRNELERRELARHALALVILTGAGRRIDDLGLNFVLAHQRIVRHMSRVTWPCVVTLSLPNPVSDLEHGRAGSLATSLTASELMLEFPA